MKTRSLLACLMLCAGLACGAASAAEPETTYEVKQGDTLMGIAKAMLADGERPGAYQRLARHNNLPDPNRLEPGTTLRIPVAWLKRTPSAVRVIAAVGEVKAGERALAVGDSVAEGEQVSTGPGGYATLEFADRSVLRIRPQSQVRVEASRASPTLAEFETRLRLGAGAVEAEVAKQRGPNFRINTPTGNMAVRGTDFRVRASGEASQVEVVGGRVGVGGAAGREVAVNEGYGTVVRQGKAPIAPVKLLGAPDLSGVAQLQERPVVRIAFAPLEGAVSYRLVVATDRELRNVAAEATVRRPVVRVVDLRDGEYFYGVRGTDALGLEGREARSSFRLKAYPLPPIPSAPAGGATLAPGSVEFAWENAEDAASFRFQLASDERFGTVILDRANLTERRVVADKLAPGRYWWRVASVRASGDAGPFGDPVRITVQEPAQSPVPSPAR